MSFLRYPKYKDSGVEWLGDVPEGWAIQRLRSLFDIRKRIVGKLGPEILSITQQGIKVKDTESNEGQLSLDYSKYQIVEPGDFAMNHMDLLTGFVDISSMYGVTSPDYRVFAVREGASVFPRFFLYVFQNAYRSKIFYAYGRGSSHLGRWRLPTDEFLNFRSPVPPLGEQEQIASFLDRETTKIDALIDEQCRLIDLLKEKRQVIISGAITSARGATNNGTTKGIDWFGPIPMHWESGALKHFCELIKDGTHLPPPRCDTGVPLLSVRNMVDGGFVRLEDDTFISEEDYGALCRSFMPKEHDVLLAIVGATLGKVAIVPSDFGIFHLQRSVAVFRTVQERLRPAYLQIVFQSTAFQSLLWSNVGFSAQPGIYLGMLTGIIVPIPPLPEQDLIIEQVQMAIGRLDTLERAANQAVLTLQERRSALISAAVSGKIDVRQPLRKPVSSVKPYSSGFAHQLLAAKILSQCNDSHMGRTKLQKLIHVAEHHAQIEELRGEYTRKMAGPLDMRAVQGLERGLERLRWFKTIREPDRNRYRYIPLEKHEQHSKYLQRWADKQARIDEVLTLMGGMTMRQCEIISTLYAAWNDLLIDKLPVTDEAILAQAATAEGWHESKEKTPREKWIAALQWMKDKGLVPTGFGMHTRKAKAENEYEPA